MRKKVDNSLKMSTVLTMIVVIASIIYSYVHCSISIYLIVLVVLLVLSPILYIPYKVIEDQDSYIIARVVGRKEYKKKDYRQEYISLKGKGFTLRLFGTAFWVYWGYFWNRKMGVYFGNHLCSDRVLLLTNTQNGKKIVIDVPQK